MQRSTVCIQYGDPHSINILTNVYLYFLQRIQLNYPRVVSILSIWYQSYKTNLFFNELHAQCLQNFSKIKILSFGWDFTSLKFQFRSKSSWFSSLDKTLFAITTKLSLIRNFVSMVNSIKYLRCSKAIYFLYLTDLSLFSI